ncbi:hypothetical protein [Castellaniella sp. MT123]|uniref:hypothetical protein n=1 Tax=Castellaniella sp. MT123 TaxID=3140381 RepID=UPI0031F3BFD3
MTMQQSFSRRHGLDVAVGALQYDYLPPAFRMELMRQIQHLAVNDGEEGAFVREYVIYREITTHVNQAPAIMCFDVDQIYEFYRHEHLQDFLLTAAWHEVISIVEILVRRLGRKAINAMFEAHRLGYVVPDLHAVEEPYVEIYYEGVAPTVEATVAALAPHADIAKALNSARADLVDPSSVNAARAAASAINALEAFVKRWFVANNRKEPATLHDAVKELKAGQLADANFINAMEQFYIWRNRTSGVGHGGSTPPTVSVSDALLVLDQACSFINFMFRLGKPAPASANRS